MTTLVDSNVLLDVMTEVPEWSEWSAQTLARCAEEFALAINPLIFAEVSIRFERIEELDEVPRRRLSSSAPMQRSPA